MPEKFPRLQSSTLSLFSQKQCLLQTLQKFLGCSNIAVFAVSHTHLHSCELQWVLSSNHKKPSDRFMWCVLLEPAWTELLWWQDLLVTAKSLVPPTPTISMASDAF